MARRADRLWREPRDAAQGERAKGGQPREQRAQQLRHEGPADRPEQLGRGEGNAERRAVARAQPLVQLLQHDDLG